MSNSSRRSSLGRIPRSISISEVPNFRVDLVTAPPVSHHPDLRVQLGNAGHVTGLVRLQHLGPLWRLVVVDLEAGGAGSDNHETV